MKESYQKLFDDYTTKIDAFLELVRMAVKGDEDAKVKICAMIDEENGYFTRISTDRNIFEVILESVGDAKEDEDFKGLREKVIEQMKEEFEFFLEWEEKKRDDYGFCFPFLDSTSENYEKYNRSTDISRKYPRLFDSWYSEYLSKKEKAVQEESNDDDENDESCTISDDVGDAIGRVIAAPIIGLANIFDWLAEKIPVAG